MRLIPRHCRGMALIQFLACLALFAALSLLTAELFNTWLKIIRETPARDTLLTRMDSALDTLRRDVWAASEIRAGIRGTDDPARLELRTPAGEILWHAQPDGRLIRTCSDEPPRTWISMPAFRFVSPPQSTALVLVEVHNQRTTEQVTLVSQRLAGGAP